MAALAIKVRRTDLITALEARIVELPKEKAAYDKAMEQWKKERTLWAKKALKAGLVELYENPYSGPQLNWSEKALETRPVEPTEPSVRHYDVANTIKQIEQGLKILRLSDEEFVPASVSKNLASLI